MPDFDASAILAVLTSHGVRFVVIGGFAGIVHGSPLPTRDVDVVPETSQENLSSLSRALTELDARIRVGDEEPLPLGHDATSLSSAAFWNLTTRFGDLDVTFTPSGTTGYSDLKREAVRIAVQGIEVDVASLADIIRSKEAAGRDKDRRALPILRELLADDLRARRER